MRFGAAKQVAGESRNQILQRVSFNNNNNNTHFYTAIRS